MLKALKLFQKSFQEATPTGRYMLPRTGCYFGRYDYPVDLLYPKSRKSYEQFIESLDYPEPGPVTKKKAAFLICYMGTEEISISNQYSTRPITNDKIGMPKWNKQKVRGLLDHGDEKMTLIANRVVEKFSTL